MFLTFYLNYVIIDLWSVINMINQGRDIKGILENIDFKKNMDDLNCIEIIKEGEKVPVRVENWEELFQRFNMYAINSNKIEHCGGKYDISLTFEVGAYNYIANIPYMFLSCSKQDIYDTLLFHLSELKKLIEKNEPLVNEFNNGIIKR